MSQLQEDAVIKRIIATKKVVRAVAKLGCISVLCYPAVLVAEDLVLKEDDRAAFLEFLLAVDGIDDDEFDMALENGLHDAELEQQSSENTTQDEIREDVEQ